jgi:hypothetical protein
VNVAFSDGSTIWPCGCVVITGAVLTLIETIALPFEQFASETMALISIELVTVTVRDEEAEVMPLCVKPSDQRTFHGPVPLSVNGILTDVVPQETLIDAGSVMVGRGAIATSAVPLALQADAEVTVTPR